MHYLRKYVFERIETNNKKDIMLEKVDRFVCENVWYFQAFIFLRSSRDMIDWENETSVEW